MTVGPAVSNLYFQGSGLTDAQSANTAVGAFWLAIVSLFPAYGTAVTEPVATELDTAGNLVALFGVTPITRTGTDSNDALPPQTQGLLRMSTGYIVNNRELKGHMFIPGPCEDSNAAGGAVIGGYRTTLDAAAAGLIAASIPWVVWSRKNATSVGVSAASTASKWGILRSRRD